MSARSKDADDKLYFEASAYLQTLLGRELFRRDEFALVELVKNAYDAGATEVTISIRPPSTREPGRIELTDNGSGMSLEDFRKTFLFAGYSERPSQVAGANRVPTGEKGVGRFATDRLGSRLIVRTKTRGEREGLQVDINWLKFGNRRRRLSDIPVPYLTFELSEFPRNGSGTHLLISGLRQKWRPRDVDAVQQALEELIDPYDPPRNFRIQLFVPNTTRNVDDVRKAPPHQADIELKLDVLKDGRTRRRIVAGGRKEKDPTDLKATDASQRLANLQVRLLYYLERPSKESVRRWTPGVRIYRDGFRVEPFGDERADWLNIAEERAKRAGHAHVVPSRLFGFVGIGRREHPNLRDTTSREALLQTEEAIALVTFLREQIRFLSDLIRTRFAEPRWKESVRRRAGELEQARLHVLSMEASGLAHELRQPLQSIRSAAGNIGTRLKQLGVADDDIRDAQVIIDEDIQRIDTTITNLGNFASGRLDTIDEFDSAEHCREIANRVKRPTDSKAVAINVSANSHSTLRSNKALFEIVIRNLLQNSVDALVAAKTQHARIDVRIKSSRHGQEITVSDNGPGIPKDVQSAVFKKFASKKTGGLGLGLYHCRMIVTALEGRIAFLNRASGTVFTVFIPNAAEIP